MLRKKESESKALRIVEEMITENVQRETFRKAVSDKSIILRIIDPINNSEYILCPINLFAF